MKKLIPFLLALVSASAAAAPALVPGQHVYTDGFYTGTSPTLTLTGVASGDFIPILITFAGSGQTFTSVTDSNGTVSNCVPLVNPGAGWNGAIYYVANTATGTHTITVNPTVGGGQGYSIAIAEYSGVATTSPCDVGGTTTTGTTTSMASSSVTPTANGDLLLSMGTQNGSGDAISGWTNGFASVDTHNTNVTSAWASFVQTTAAAISTTATNNFSGAPWGLTIASFKPASGASCTHSGKTSGGALTVPTASTTVVSLKSGALSTVDCSTTQYLQPTVGNFGAN